MRQVSGAGYFCYGMANPIESSEPTGRLAFIAARRAGADMKLLTLLDEIWQDPAGFDALADADLVRRTVLGFKYWVDEPGTDSIRYWGESAALGYNACAYLAGRLLPDEMFESPGLRGAELADRGEQRIHRWLSLCFRRGMTEWLANRTLIEVLAALVILIDRAPDPEIVQRASIVMDLLLLDVAMHGFEGDFAPAQARDTPDGGINAVLAWLREAHGEAPQDALAARIMQKGAYAPPSVLQAIAYDQRTALIRSTMGINPADVLRESDGRAEEASLLAWRIGAYDCPETWKVSHGGYRRWGLARHPALAPVRRRSTGLTRFLPSTGRVEFPRARLTNFRTRHYQLSSAQAYKVGEIGAARPWLAVLPGGIHVTSVHPRRRDVSGPAGVLPAVGQDEHVALVLYDTRRHDVEAASRVTLPLSQCDDTRIGRTWVAAQARGTFFGLLSASPLELSARDLVFQRGHVTGWAVVMGDRSQSESLGEFVAMLKNSSLSLDHDSLQFRLDRTGHYSLDPHGSIAGPRGLVCHPATRYSNPWVLPSIGRGVVDVECANHTLHIDWTNAVRTWT